MKSNFPPLRRGFTLVELLVVIAIIASLAALSMTVGPRMMAKAKATESMRNIRQIGPLLTAYASDNSMKLPPAVSTIVQENGAPVEQQWNEVCLALVYPQGLATDFKSKTWWEKNKPFLRNPLFKETALPRGWTPLNPGYALNEMISENIIKNRADNPDGAVGDPLRVAVSLASVTEPDRTPLIAPCDNWHYRYDDSEVARIKTGTINDLLVEGKLPVLFVDGHLEMVTPSEYIQRDYHLMPRPAGS